MKIRLENFEPYRGVDFDFTIPALYLCNGDNDVGKSALIRSVFYGLYRGIPTSKIHQGKQNASIKLSEGEKSVVVQRKSTGAYMDVTSAEGTQRIEKWGKLYPPVASLLGFPPTKTQAQIFNFYMQGDTFLPLQKSLYDLLFTETRQLRKVFNSKKRALSSILKVAENKLPGVRKSIEINTRLRDLSIRRSRCFKDAIAVRDIQIILDSGKQIDAVVERVGAVKESIEDVVAGWKVLNIVSSGKQIDAVAERTDKVKDGINYITAVSSLLDYLSIISQKKQAESEVGAKREILQKVIAEIGVCPICGSDLSVADIIGKPHTKEAV